jgi:hypothetical protein
MYKYTLPVSPKYRPPGPYPSPVKHRRYPCLWDTDMTLCIAAISDAFVEGEHIVGCCDWRVETSTIGAEMELKFRWLTGSWCVMVGGNNLFHAKELSDRYRQLFQRERDKINVDNLLELLRQPPQEMRRMLADSYTRHALAISYEEFLDPDTAISKDMRRGMELEIGQQQIEAELVLMGVVDRHLVVAKYLNGVVSIEEDFAAIGSGSPLAESFLFLRSQNRASPLAETIYAVYEAKRIGELAPGVGKTTHIFVMALNIEDKPFFTTLNTEDDMELLEKQLRKFGPQPLNEFLFLPRQRALLLEGH